MDDVSNGIRDGFKAPHKILAPRMAKLIQGACRGLVTMASVPCLQSISPRSFLPSFLHVCPSLVALFYNVPDAAASSLLRDFISFMSRNFKGNHELQKCICTKSFTSTAKTNHSFNM